MWDVLTRLCLDCWFFGHWPAFERMIPTGLDWSFLVFQLFLLDRAIKHCSLVLLFFSAWIEVVLSSSRHRPLSCPFSLDLPWVLLFVFSVILDYAVNFLTGSWSFVVCFSRLCTMKMHMRRSCSTDECIGWWSGLIQLISFTFDRISHYFSSFYFWEVNEESEHLGVLWVRRVKARSAQFA